MKHTIKLMLVAAVVSIGASSCAKMFDKHDRDDENEIKEVVLNVALKAGETYNLDLATYGDADDLSAITKQAINEKASTLTTTTNPFAGKYNYVADLAIPVDQVKLQITEGENGGNGIAAGGCQNGGSNAGGEHHGKKHEEITNITINFVVSALAEGRAK
jgi:hypothetical protein